MGGVPAWRTLPRQGGITSAQPVLQQLMIGRVIVNFVQTPALRVEGHQFGQVTIGVPSRVAHVGRSHLLAEC